MSEGLLPDSIPSRGDEVFFCPLCQQDVDIRLRTRDHVLPEGLGAFRDAFKTPTCHDCNTRIGKGLEDHVFTRSYYAAIRGGLGVRSAKSRKSGKVFVDPLAQARREEGERYADVIAIWKDREVPIKRIVEGGRTELPDVLFPEEDGEVVGSPIDISGMSVDQVAELMSKTLTEAKASGRKMGLRIYHNDEAFAKAVLGLVADKGFRQEDGGRESQGPMPLPCRITGFVDETHLRAHGFWLIKAMSYAGIKGPFLRHLSDYVRTGVYQEGLCFSSWKKVGEVVGYKPVVQERFGHRVEWCVFPGFAVGIVVIFGVDGAGTVATFRFKLPEECRVILIPGPGAVLAGYIKDGQPGEGWIELLQGSKVVASSRPKNDPEQRVAVRMPVHRG